MECILEGSAAFCFLPGCESTQRCVHSYSATYPLMLCTELNRRPYACRSKNTAHTSFPESSLFATVSVMSHHVLPISTISGRIVLRPLIYLPLQNRSSLRCSNQLMYSVNRALKIYVLAEESYSRCRIEAHARTQYAAPMGRGRRAPSV